MENDGAADLVLSRSLMPAHHVYLWPPTRVSLLHPYPLIMFSYTRFFTKLHTPFSLTTHPSQSDESTLLPRSSPPWDPMRLSSFVLPTLLPAAIYHGSNEVELVRVALFPPPQQSAMDPMRLSSSHHTSHTKAAQGGKGDGCFCCISCSARRCEPAAAATSRRSML